MSLNKKDFQLLLRLGEGPVFELLCPIRFPALPETARHFHGDSPLGYTFQLSSLSSNQPYTILSTKSIQRVAVHLDRFPFPQAYIPNFVQSVG